MGRTASFLPIVCLALAAGLTAARAEIVAGPVEALVVRVIDGDTFEADARVWPGHTVRVAVRIRGVDAPEMRSRCAAEKRAALRAREALVRLIGERPVRVSNVGGDKYYGRVLADVTNADGVGVAPALLGLAVVRVYDGGARVPFCDRFPAAAANPASADGDR